jgi:hypothetical protein
MDSGGGLHGSPPLALARSNWTHGSRCSARAFGSQPAPLRKPYVQVVTLWHSKRR